MSCCTYHALHCFPFFVIMSSLLVFLSTSKPFPLPTFSFSLILYFPSLPLPFPPTLPVTLSSSLLSYLAPHTPSLLPYLLHYFLFSHPLITRSSLFYPLLLSYFPLIILIYYSFISVIGEGKESGYQFYGYCERNGCTVETHGYVRVSVLTPRCMCTRIRTYFHLDVFELLSATKKSHLEFFVISANVMIQEYYIT